MPNMAVDAVVLADGRSPAYCPPVISNYKGFPVCRVSSLPAQEGMQLQSIPWRSVQLRAKGADSETTNGHWCSRSLLRTLMKDARRGLNR